MKSRLVSHACAQSSSAVMCGRRVLAAQVQAVHQRLGADVVAVRAALDALVHLLGDVLGLE
jgi:hypothetical protein